MMDSDSISINPCLSNNKAFPPTYIANLALTIQYIYSLLLSFNFADLGQNCKTKTILTVSKSKWVWSGNTKITHGRPTHHAERKSHRIWTVPRHNKDLYTFYWYQIFALDSAVVEAHKILSSHGGFPIIAMYHHGETI